MPVRRFKRGTYDRYFKRKMRTRGKRTRRMTKGFRRNVTRVLMNKVETKYYDRGVQDVQLYHNLGRGSALIVPTQVTAIPELFNVWADINQGTQRFQRVGDEIIPRGIKLNLWLANKIDRPNTKIRVIVAVLPKAFGGVVVPYDWDPLQQPNSGTLGQTTLFPADKDKGVKFLYDRIHTMGADHPGGYTDVSGWLRKERSKFVSIWIKPKKGTKIKFDTTSSTIQNRPIAVYCIPYEQYSTATSDRIASCAAFMRLYYKDP